MATYGPRLLDRGYPIVPIARGHKYPRGLDDWQNVEADAAQLAAWSATGFEGVGVLTRFFPAVDIDVLDDVTSQHLNKWCTDSFGASVVRYGRRPKRLIVYRTDAPFGKVASRKFRDLDGREHRVEVLGDGQQFAAYHVHPDTKRPYTWEGGRGLADVNSAELPTITADDARALCDYFESIVPDDWIPVSRRKEGRVGGDDFDSVAPKTDLTAAQVEKALDELTPLVSDYDYDDWVAVGMAVHHQFDGSIEGFDLWDAWSQNSVKYNAATTRGRWKSFETIHSGGVVTFASVIKDAKQARRERKKAEALASGVFDRWDDVMRKAGPIDWLVRDVMERNAIGVTFGAPGCYKSFFAMSLAFSIATGRDWYGCKVRQGPVFYIAGEGHNGIARRGLAWGIHHGLDTRGCDFWVSKKAIQFNDADAAELVGEEVSRLGEAAGRVPELVIIDTLAKNFGPGDEDKNADIGHFLDAVTESLKIRGHASTVLIVHHSGHGDKKRARGGSALHGGVDFEYRLERIEDSQRIKVACTKMKDAPEPGDIYFEAREVVVGEFDGEEAASLVLVKCDPPAEEVGSKLTGRAAALFELIKREGPIRRDYLRKMAIEAKAVANAHGFRNVLLELRKAGLVTDGRQEGDTSRGEDLIDAIDAFDADDAS